MVARKLARPLLLLLPLTCSLAFPHSRRRRSPKPPPKPPSPGPPTPWQPFWAAPAPSLSLPLGGYAAVPSTEHTLVYGANAGNAYNHAAMLDYLNGTLLVAWKNGLESEDKRGQKILFSSSADGRSWKAASVLFPDMSTAKQSAAMFVGPPIQIRGRWYVGASPGVPTGAAQGAQFCLWPDPINLPSDLGGRRNCGPPGHAQAKDTLLMRQVLVRGPGVLQLGEIFWFAAQVPAQWAEASRALGFRTIDAMDPTTRADMATLSPEMGDLPCGPRKCKHQTTAPRGPDLWPLRLATVQPH